MKKKETLNFRVSPEFKRRLIAAAKKEHRSITNYVETALTSLWEQQAAAVKAMAKAEKRRPRTGRTSEGKVKIELV